jgi:hypothetical protein
LDELRDLDLLEEERILCDEENLRKAKVISDLVWPTLIEEVSWRQKVTSAHNFLLNGQLE